MGFKGFGCVLCLLRRGRVPVTDTARFLIKRTNIVCKAFGLGLKVSGSGFRDPSAPLYSDSGLRVEASGFRVPGAGFRV